MAMEAAVYPTIVLARGASSELVAQKLAHLLQAHRSPLRHVVAIGTANDGGYTAIHLPEAHTDEPFFCPLAQWMHAIRTEENLTTARDAGIAVGPPGGYLFVQVLLLVDSTHDAEVPKLLQALRQCSWRSQEEVPVRSYLLVLHPSYDLSTLYMDGWEQVEPDGWLVPVSLTIAGLTRSDGSNITREHLTDTLPYLLYAALHSSGPAGEHWLFTSRANGSPAPHTLGFGLLVLPLPDIEKALTDKLVADTFSPLLEEPSSPPPIPAELTLDETSWWQFLTSKLLGLVSAGAGLTLTLLRQEKPPVGEDPRRWLSQADEWDERWQRETLVEWEKGLQEAADEMLDIVRRKIREEVQRYFAVLIGAVPLLRRLTTYASEAIEKWSIWKQEEAKLPTESLQRARAEFETALQNLPETAWLVRWSLVIAVVGWLVLGLAGYLVFTELALPLAWVVPAVVGLPMLIGAGGAWFQYRQRRRVVDEAWQGYIRRLQEFHTAQMRLTALQTLRSAAEQLQDIVRRETAQAEQLAQQVEGTVWGRQAAALGLRLLAPPWLKLAITTWKHLEPVAQELWGHRDLRELLRQRAKKEGLMTTEHWLKSMDRLASDLHRSLVNHWMTPQHRRLTYYLRQRFGSEERLREWLEEQMRQLSEEASCLLWRSDRPPLQSWRFVEPALPPIPVDGDEMVVEVPDMVGRVCLGEARVEPI